MHVSILIEGFNANKTYKIYVLLPSEKSDFSFRDLSFKSLMLVLHVHLFTNYSE